MKTTINIKGTHCASCKSVIEDIASEIPGIISADVNYQTGVTSIEHEKEFDWQRFKNEIESIGNYTVEIPSIK